MWERMGLVTRGQMLLLSGVKGREEERRERGEEREKVREREGRRGLDGEDAKGVYNLHGGSFQNVLQMSDDLKFSQEIYTKQLNRPFLYLNEFLGCCFGRL